MLGCCKDFLPLSQSFVSQAHISQKKGPLICSMPLIPRGKVQPHAPKIRNSEVIEKWYPLIATVVVLIHSLGMLAG